MEPISAAGLRRVLPSGTMDLTVDLTGAQEKGTSGVAQPTDAAHGSGGPRGLPGAELPNAPLASSTWPRSPSGAAAAVRHVRGLQKEEVDMEEGGEKSLVAGSCWMLGRRGGLNASEIESIS
uniref:Uncharacterized protein n=1 Tax=Sphaerodactylus townsendi TaxID=933632 RepID=A0ACB8FVZ0_9SAUR